jgi:hypothetical protein
MKVDEIDGEDVEMARIDEMDEKDIVKRALKIGLTAALIIVGLIVLFGTFYTI